MNGLNGREVEGGGRVKKVCRRVMMVSCSWQSQLHNNYHISKQTNEIYSWCERTTILEIFAKLYVRKCQPLLVLRISAKNMLEQKTCNKPTINLCFCIAAPNNYVCKPAPTSPFIIIGNFIILQTFNKGEDVPAVKLISGIETL